MLTGSVEVSDDVPENVAARGQDKTMGGNTVSAQTQKNAALWFYFLLLLEVFFNFSKVF